MTKQKTKKSSKVKEAKPKEEVKESTSASIEFNKNQAYPIEQALKLTKKLSKTKFDASVEVHFRLGIDPRKGDQQIRSAVSLPHGTGKTVRVAAFITPEKEKEVKAAGADLAGGLDLIEKIKKTEKTDFEVAVAEPAMMKNLAPIAKILGTRGLMPSPKSQTVTPDPAKAVAELKKGKISFKNDDTGNIHSAIGKVSFDAQKLLENYNTLLEAIKKTKPSSSKGLYIRNIAISSSMGPGIKVNL